MNTQPTPPSGTTPTNRPPRPARQRRPVNPLVKPKRPGQSHPGPPKPASQAHVSNTTFTGRQTVPKPSNQTQQPKEAYEDTPIFTTRRSLLEGTRHHVMRMFPSVNVARKDINIADQTQFIPPVRLHRRDPRTNPALHWKEGGASSESEDEKKPNNLDQAAREEAEAAKAARRAEREANQAMIAPTLKSESHQKKKKQHQKKTEMVYQFSDSLLKAKNQQVRYEEALPWHLEDFDNNNIWAGTYEAALSEMHVMLVDEPESKSYRMVPLEKWYKFLPKTHFQTLSIEEAEARMSKSHDMPRWFMRAQETDQTAKEAKVKSEAGNVFTRRGERGEKPVRATSAKREDADEERPEQAQDADDIDYDYDEAFADDEENPIFGGDEEENKAAEEKLRRERADANIFELKEEKDYDKEEEEENQKAEEEKKKARKLIRALEKREKNYDYESDSDEESDSSDNDEEKREETQKQEVEARANGQLSAKPVLASGTTSQGRNTPVPDELRKTLKRPVSPGQSDASGSESNRKKQKKTHLSSAGATAAMISRPTSPADSLNGARRDSTIKLTMSPRKHDMSAASGSEGEMSEGARRKKFKTKASSRPGSPNGSRAASPANVPSIDITPAPDAATRPVTAQAIAALVPPEGMFIQDLIKHIPKAVMKGNKGFVQELKSYTTWDAVQKRFYPK